MVDTDVVGCCWIELPKGKYCVREEKDALASDSQNPGKVGQLPASGSCIVVPPLFFFLFRISIDLNITARIYFFSFRCPCVSMRWILDGPIS